MSTKASFDCKTLTIVIERCFDLSMDSAVPVSQQRQLLTQGKLLRGHLLNLLTAKFDKEVTEYKQASKSLRGVNEQLASRAKALKDTADTVEQVARLVKVLDELLAIAASFI